MHAIELEPRSLLAIAAHAHRRRARVPSSRVPAASNLGAPAARCPCRRVAAAKLAGLGALRRQWRTDCASCTLTAERLPRMHVGPKPTVMGAEVKIRQRATLEFTTFEPPPSSRTDAANLRSFYGTQIFFKPDKLLSRCDKTCGWNGVW